MISGLVFDLDDTLIDRGKSVELFSTEYWKSNNLEIDKKSFIEKINKLDGTGYTPRDEFFSSVAKEFSFSKQQLSYFQEYFYEIVWVKPVVLEGTIEYLKFFSEKGLRIGIVTNGRHQAQSEKIKNSGFSHLIDKTLISESFGKSKPDPEIFRAISSSLDLDVKSSWFIGDHPINDIFGSKQVGFNAAWLQKSIEWPANCEECYNFKANSLLKIFEDLENYV